MSILWKKIIFVVLKELLTTNLKQEIDVKFGFRRREERYLYYKAVAKELIRKAAVD